MRVMRRGYVGVRTDDVGVDEPAYGEFAWFWRTPDGRLHSIQQIPD